MKVEVGTCADNCNIKTLRFANNAFFISPSGHTASGMVVVVIVGLKSTKQLKLYSAQTLSKIAEKEHQKQTKE